ALEINRHQTLCKKAVARPVAAVFINRRSLHWQVDEPGFRIDRDLRPHTDIAGPLPRTVLPRFIPELAPIRNRVEPPDLFARTHMEGGSQAFGVGAVNIAKSFSHRGSDDDGVVDDRGS